MAEQEDFFINEEIDQFKDNPLTGIAVNPKTNTEKDQVIIGSYCGHNVFSKITATTQPTLRESVQDVIDLANLLTEHSHNIDKMTASYRAGENVDEAVIDMEFDKKPNYMFYGLYSSYLNPNQHFLGYHFSKYPQSSIFKHFRATQFKFGYDWTEGEKKFTFSQLFAPYNDIHTEFREELASKNLCDNVRQIRRQTSLVFKKYLEDPSELFPYHSFSDTHNYAFLQVGSKRLTHDVDTNKASSELMKLTLNHQKLFAIKLGLLRSNFEDLLFEDGYTSELSAEYNKDPQAPPYTHLRAHYRRFKSFEPYLVQWHAKLDKIVGDTDSRIWMRNFKGIKDVGKKAYKSNEERVQNNVNKLPSGDPLGHKTVLDFGVKLTSKELPYFKMYQIECNFWTMRPFIFTNIAVLPDEFIQGNSLIENIKQNSVVGGGIGFQVIHPWAAFEVYYSAVILKNKYEFGTEIQFNFGLD